MLLGTNLPRIMQHFTGLDDNNFWISRNTLIVAACVVVLPIAFFKNLSKYAITSVICLSMLFTVVFVLFGFFCANTFDKGLPDNAATGFGGDMFYSLGGISYLYVCQDVSIEVAAELKKPTRNRWRVLCAVVCAMSCLSFLFIGIVGYLYVPNNVPANILDALPRKNFVANIARIIHCFTIALSVPYNIFMPRLSLFTMASLLFFKRSPPSHRAMHIYHMVSTVLLVAVGCTIAVLVNNLGAAYAIIGAVAASGIGFILPAGCFLSLETGSLLSPKKVIHLCILAVGLFVTIVGSVAPFVNIQDLFS
eukprot:CAMPEP_0177630002 /NCGR_PEP_ID=MMETSP0447-20121125/976_1 /TAXON_ID=0 /ORGANISM="Stygamoeba regulata, Strain BSH-02190019" /LENGTH=306 /DNA_ID=CAMNT_0019131375 /DNA_START=336 /DNA_END=1256 /DNA_ORIENTATION=-